MIMMVVMWVISERGCGLERWCFGGEDVVGVWRFCFGEGRLSFREREKRELSIVSEEGKGVRWFGFGLGCWFGVGCRFFFLFLRERRGEFCATRAVGRRAIHSSMLSFKLFSLFSVVGWMVGCLVGWLSLGVVGVVLILVGGLVSPPSSPSSLPAFLIIFFVFFFFFVFGLLLQESRRAAKASMAFGDVSIDESKSKSRSLF